MQYIKGIYYCLVLIGGMIFLFRVVCAVFRNVCAVIRNVWVRVEELPFSRVRDSICFKIPNNPTRKQLVYLSKKALYEMNYTKTPWSKFEKLCKDYDYFPVVSPLNCPQTWLASLCYRDILRRDILVPGTTSVQLVTERRLAILEKVAEEMKN